MLPDIGFISIYEIPPDRFTPGFTPGPGVGPEISLYFHGDREDSGAK
jgi:hypothetical protein